MVLPVPVGPTKSSLLRAVRPCVNDARRMALFATLAY